jgi:hypothetical protein
VPKLMQVAERLQIKDAIEAALEDELGNELFNFFGWVRDWFVGRKRECYGQSDVWDEYEEGTRSDPPSEGLTQIMQASEQAEEALTGPYFLAGQADQDLASHTRWRDLPPTTRSAVERELLAIKNRYVSGGAKPDGVRNFALERFRSPLIGAPA